MSDDNKNSTSKVESYSFIGKENFHILGVKIANNFKLEKKLKDNEAFMKRFNHALKIGVVIKG
tara:strand:+ start:10408 stop:10596 length:189 start_codon:yes stop_codon:yes gene_type:complete